MHLCVAQQSLSVAAPGFSPGMDAGVNEDDRMIAWTHKEHRQ